MRAGDAAALEALYQRDDSIAQAPGGATVPVAVGGDWRRLVCIGCRAEPALYTAVWAQRRRMAATRLIDSR